ncbi:Imm52 family immunity protein [Pluralibacter gergoviae]|uniref:Imm52 family immunity protein n=1 Tax=Pluralibacter gergoviae TaxID=61647 RepID=A0AAW8HTJ8_PLUGE|nr:Imm52 family immunity protein [Pluralibacter gergoviae]AVR04444.1 hypothetical protein A8H26_17925 [Pluralibacter gergoviae]MDQ2310840.1 Imm52 family immunity protein [Pluralibacter gergoviae]SUB71210.1 Uncharacterised protein [Pluralibacter gergoviae]
MFYKMQFIFYRKNEASAIEIFDEVSKFINLIPNWPEKPAEWLIAHPMNEMIAIKSERVTAEALKYVDTLMNEDDVFNFVLADKNKDDSVLTIWVMNTPAVSTKRYYLTLTMKSLSGTHDKNTFINFIMRILTINAWEFKFVLLDTEQYDLRMRSVFDDRLSVGWMLYLPKIINRDCLLNASEVIYCNNNPGTLIISKDNFNGNLTDDINIANNIEIELSSHGELPKISEL